jgi:hypothetical protein
MQGAAASSVQVNLNQSYIESVIAEPTLDISDPMSVFASVFSSLPADVRVYPTENYFYFNFYHGGTRFAGNIRLDALDRDKGIVHFAYFPDYTEWGRGGELTYRALDKTSGVGVTKISALVYALNFRGRTVTFRLNDLSTVKPGPGFLRADERFLGPVFDESGVQFFLIFNERLKTFHFFLNEDAKATERYRTADVSRRILIGERTGFAFFRDRHRDRKVLIGVYESNSRTNSYLDGPFDQLPDNFLKNDDLQQAIVSAKPELAGKIDRFGNLPGGAERFYIGPYKSYRNDEDLLGFVECSEVSARADEYYKCFEHTDDDGLQQ